MNKDVVIRMATEADVADLLDIYAYYVINTAISFEYEVPSLEEFAARMRLVRQRYPYLVLIKNGQLCGFAYATAFKNRAAYDYAVETTIYLRHDCRGGGLGKMLYQALEQSLKRQNVINLNACIATAPEENEYITFASERFHEGLGYKKVAHFTQCGYKFNRWFDMIWMEKMLSEHPINPAPFIPINELKATTFKSRG